MTSPPDDRRASRLAYWFYRLLLVAYPPSFRRVDGHVAAETFAHLHRDTAGVLGRARLWGRALGQVAIGGWRARLADRAATVSPRAWPAWSADQVARDAKAGIRAWRRRPAHAAVAVATLALGIGVNLAVTNLLVTLFLRPPLGTDGGRLVSLTVTDGVRVDSEFSADQYLALASGTDALSGLAAEQFGWVWLTGAGAATEIEGALVSFNYFDLLGVRPAAGRLFTAADDGVVARHSVVVISHALWTDQLGRDPTVVGRTARVNGQPVVVIGVAPAGFSGLFAGQRRDLWMPHDMRPTTGAGGAAVLLRAGGSFDLVGRLATGRTPGAAAAELDAVLAQVTASSQRQAPLRTIVEPLRGVHPEAREGYVGPARLALAVAAALLLLTCLNLGGLLLARNLSRRRELALRLALGGTRRRLVRQLFVEALVLAAVAASAGIVAAIWGHELIARWYAYTLPGLALAVDWRFLGLATGLALAVALGFGAVPAWLSTRRDLLGALKAVPAPTSVPGAHTRGQHALLVAQVVLSLLLLAGAAIMTQSLQHVMASAGTSPEQVLHYRLRPSRVPYDAPTATRYQHDVLRRVSAVPGAIEAALATVGHERGWCCPLRVSASAEDEGFEVDNNSVTPAFLDVLQIPILRGRGFTDADAPGAPLVTLVNEALARRLWPDADPLGRTLFADDRAFEVVGVTPTVHASRPGEGPIPYAYFAYWQSGAINGRLFVRYEGAIAGVAAGISQALQAAGPDVHVGQFGTLAERTRLSHAPQQALASLLQISAVTAVLLTMLGLYAQLSIATERSKRETAIRLAIGASARQVLGRVVTRGLRLTGVGVAIGLVGVWALRQSLASLVYGVAPADPVLVGVAVALLAATTALTALLPALRAVRVDPVTLLRDE